MDPRATEAWQRLEKQWTATAADGDRTEDHRIRVAFHENGGARYLSLSPPLIAAAPTDAVTRAAEFLDEHARLLGAQSEALALNVAHAKLRDDRTIVQFEQTYNDIPIFGTQVIVQLDSSSAIECVLSDILHDTDALDRGNVPSDPVIDARQAGELARAAVASTASGVVIRSTQPELYFFSPSVLGRAGPVRLVWNMLVLCDQNPTHDERVLLDAHKGDIVRRYPMAKSALDREVYDSNNSTDDPGTLVRAEGDDPCGIADADDAYDYLEDTYAFFFDHHGRDGIDDAGMLLEATVRYCRPGEDCPDRNAFWLGSVERMYFAQGWVTDDILGHELTHGITDHESNLIYENHSGAINESLSDVWGEYIDLTNGAGDDDASLRWEIGEELVGGPLRDMSDPPRFDQPDRMGHADFVSPSSFPGPGNDWGGVHTNSGVNNKLCYLLTDGVTFNSWRIYRIGLARVADLYYEANTNLLPPAADYQDLYYVLMQSALNLGWLPGDRANLHKACAAVEIADTDADVYVDRDHFGIETGSDTFPFDTIAEAHSNLDSRQRVIIKSGAYNENITLHKNVLLVSRNGTVRIGS